MNVTTTIDTSGSIAAIACSKASRRASQVFDAANARRLARDAASSAATARSIASTKASAPSASDTRPSAAIEASSGSPTLTTGLPAASIS